jgi:hypothetical protein
VSIPNGMRASHGTGIVECGSVIRNVMYLGWRLQKVGVSDLFGLVCSYSYVVTSRTFKLTLRFLNVTVAPLKNRTGQPFLFGRDTTIRHTSGSTLKFLGTFATVNQGTKAFQSHSKDLRALEWPSPLEPTSMKLSTGAPAWQP